MADIDDASVILSESLNCSDSDWQYHLEDLPNELLILILGYLPLQDLVNTRSVCSRLQRLVDDSACRHLWANATLEGNCLWLTKTNKKLIQRAADHGNVEALIMLGVAHLYSEGVPEGAGKGTYDAVNGIKATEYLIRSEGLTAHSPPFSWVLFRPPWANNSMCCKACVCQRMKNHCLRGIVTASPTGIHYSIGKVLEFLDNTTDSEGPQHWYELGSEAGCLHSRLELWRSTHKKQLLRESLEPLRQLRAIVSQSGSSSLLEAQLELCSAYARGFYGGKSQTEALSFVSGVMGRARPVLWKSVYRLQESMSHNVRYILIDWIIEVAGMKLFSPQTVHLAINLIDRYLVQRAIPRSNLQLLGITSLLLAARWSSEFILTVREASWLTEETYQYEDVVRMMGGMVAIFRGEIKTETVTDYLDVMLDLARADTPTRYTAYYLSESLLLFVRFGCYSASHLAAACLLEARVLLGIEFPWSQSLAEATGFTVSDLRGCCLAIYDACLTDKNAIMDYRRVKLESVAIRYANESFGGVSKLEFMPYDDFKKQLGLDPDLSLLSLTPMSEPRQKNDQNDRLLSFLSDSCYLTPETKRLSDMSDSKYSESDSDISGNLGDEFEDQYLSSESNSPNPLNFIASEMNGMSPFSPSQCSSKSLAISPSSNSRFPQPLFDEMTLSSPPGSSPTLEPAASFHPRSDISSDSMDTEDTLFAQSKGTYDAPLEMSAVSSPLAGPTPHCTSTNGLVQGSEETPIECDLQDSRHTSAADQPLFSVSNSLKTFRFREHHALSDRVVLKSVENVPSPFLGVKTTNASGETGKMAKSSIVSKRNHSIRKGKLPSRK